MQTKPPLTDIPVSDVITIRECGIFSENTPGTIWRRIEYAPVNVVSGERYDLETGEKLPPTSDVNQ